MHLRLAGLVDGVRSTTLLESFHLLNLYGRYNWLDEITSCNVPSELACEAQVPNEFCGVPWATTDQIAFHMESSRHRHRRSRGGQNWEWSGQY